MKRIGVTASKISKGNIFLYNFYVVVISFLFSFFMYIIASMTVLFAIVLISYMGRELLPIYFQHDWYNIYVVCMMALTIVMIIFTLMLIFKNFKLSATLEYSEDKE
jgi:phosphotransferase system  glucose/maltose/N-acetylglucosamine-specific IIC component